MSPPRVPTSNPIPAGQPRAVRRPAARWARRSRRVAGLLSVLVAFTLGWTLLNRVLAPGHAVTAATLPPSAVRHPVLRPNPDTFRVAAWNIAHARGPEGTSNWTGPREQRLNDIADLIATWDADVVVLNEVDFDCTWSGRIDQASWIAERAGYPHYATQRNYDVSLPFFRLRFGNAVLSRWPMDDVQRVPLPHVAAWEALLIGRKDALCVTVRRDDQPVRILAVHLDVRDRKVRQQSVPHLASRASAHMPPLIAAGDFNCKLIEISGQAPGPKVATSAGTRMLDEAGLAWVTRDEQAQLGGSFPAAQPNRLIDYILADPRLPMTRFKIIGSTLSDHRPVLADLGWPPTGDAR